MEALDRGEDLETVEFEAKIQQFCQILAPLGEKAAVYEPHIKKLIQYLTYMSARLAERRSKLEAELDTMKQQKQGGNQGGGSEGGTSSGDTTYI